MVLEAVPADTGPAAALVQLQIYRRMPAARRLEVALQLSDGLRRLVAAGVRSRHPACTEEQVRLAVLRLTLGETSSHQDTPATEDRMSQEDLLADMVQRLEAAGIPFMITGTHASSFHGQPRATNALDIVVDPNAEQLAAFVASLGDRHYVSAAAAQEAFARRSIFNVIDFGSGWKVHLILRKERPFSVEEFRRRREVVLHGCRVAMASAEDVILSKLEWDKITPSERQVQDALNVAVVQSLANMDLIYLRQWAAVLGVAEKLETVLELAVQAQPPPSP